MYESERREMAWRRSRPQLERRRESGWNSYGENSGFSGERRGGHRDVSPTAERAAEIYRERRLENAMGWVENEMAWEQYEEFRARWAENMKDALWERRQERLRDSAWAQARQNPYY